MVKGNYGKIQLEGTTVAAFSSWELKNNTANGMTLQTIAIRKLTIFDRSHPFKHQIQQFLASLNNFHGNPFFTVHLYDELAGSVVDTKHKCQFTHINPIAPGSKQYDAIIAVQD